MKRNKFSNYLCVGLFLLITFFPIISFGEMRIPTPLFFAPLLFFSKTLLIEKKVFSISIISTLLLMCFYLPIVLNNQGTTAKDVIFAFFPLYICLLYHLMINIITGTDNKVLQKCMKAFLLIQLVFCILQLTNLFNTNSIFERLYYFWQSNNAQKTSNYLEVAYRAFGTMGSPIILGVLSYLFGSYLLHMNKRNIWFYLLSIILVILSGARMPLLAILIIELYQRVIKNFIKKPLYGILMLLTILIGGYLTVRYVPFINMVFEKYISTGVDMSSDYSVSYRLDMMNMAKENGSYMIFGGFGSNNFPDYVDSEIILRLLQFGIINMIFVLSFYFYKYCDLCKKLNQKAKSDLRSITFFLLICSITSVVFTNFLVSQVIIIGFCIFQTKNIDAEVA